MAEAKKSAKKRKGANNIYKAYKIEGGKAVMLRKSCPKCGAGVFMAEHKDRVTCGRCHYTEFSGKKK